MGLIVIECGVFFSRLPFVNYIEEHSFFVSCNLDKFLKKIQIK